MKNSKKRTASNKDARPLKKTFTVGENETIDSCIERMRKEGYTPVKRVERPIFREGKTGPECIGSHCVLEGRLNKAKSEQ
ncbi:NETI motif-containing protein [Sporolactobacillus sp. THM7-4]|nr:NETI motif-containing protein [Sporolactobacillus sp. THM7-4]